MLRLTCGEPSDERISNERRRPGPLRGDPAPRESAREDPDDRQSKTRPSSTGAKNADPALVLLLSLVLLVLLVLKLGREGSMGGSGGGTGKWDLA